MPAITTHYSFAKEVEVQHPTEFKEAFYLGSQGPDPFFFYGQLPLHKRKNAKAADAMGRNLHHIDITEVYYALLDYANHSEDKALLDAYIHGLFLHYLLDRSCHAYIFPRAGFGDDGNLGKKYGVLHCEFETFLDILIGRKKGTFSYHCYRFIVLPKKQLLAISKMWSVVNAAVTHYPDIDELTFYHSVKDYQGTEEFVNVPHGFKRWLLKHMVGEMSLPFAMNFPKEIPARYKDCDFLNESHQSWPDAVSGVEHKESFWDLWNQAAADYEKLLPMLSKAEQGEDIRGELKVFVDNRCHDGCEVGAKRAYRKEIWPS
jgi:hypothetical protein